MVEIDKLIAKLEKWDTENWYMKDVTLQRGEERMDNLINMIDNWSPLWKKFRYMLYTKQSLDL